MAALVGLKYDNQVLDQLYASFLIVQVSKMPGGNLRLKLKTQKVCLKLERTTVIILGQVYSFQPSTSSQTGTIWIFQTSTMQNQIFIRIQGCLSSRVSQYTPRFAMGTW